MIDSYVDDSNLSVNEEGVKEYNKKNGQNLKLEEASVKAYQGYERYLFLSGGKLALHKCKYYWITFLIKEKKVSLVVEIPETVELHRRVYKEEGSSEITKSEQCT